MLGPSLRMRKKLEYPPGYSIHEITNMTKNYLQIQVNMRRKGGGGEKINNCWHFNIY